ncbi:MAG: hypothetical protein IJP03_05815 [Christensenellaceae bacterium]|nr:hypothetical protein [Christensenellaceae bacterium]
MKKLLSFALALIMTLTLCLVAAPMPAKAVDNVDMDVDFTPTSLLTGGNINLTVVVTNNGDDIQDAVLTVDGTVMKEFGNLVSGDTKEFEGSFHVPTEKIGQNIKVMVTYLYGEETKAISQMINVAQKEANIDVEGVVKVDKSAVPQNTQVEFTFVIENQGDTKIENVKVSAPALNSGNPVNKEAFSLEAGKSKMVKYVGTIMKSITVEPVVSFTAAGKEYTKKLASLEVLMSDASLSLVITPSATEVEAGAEVSFDVKLENTGNIDFSNVKLLNGDGVSLPLESSSLAQGASMTTTAAMTFEESRQVSFQVTADGSDAQNYTFTSNVVDIAVAAIDPTEYASQLKLEVLVDDSKVEEEGVADLTLKLINSGEEVFTNVVISEATLGNIDSLASMAPGTREVARSIAVTEEATYTFKVTATDPAGNPVSISSQPIRLAPPADEEGGAGDKLGVLLWVVIVIVVLIIATGITLLVLVRKDKKQKAAEEEKARRTAARRTRAARAAAAAAAAKAQGEEEPQRAVHMLDLEVEAPEDEAFEDEEELPAEEEGEDLDLFAAEEEPAQPTVRRRPTVTARKIREKEDFDDSNSF